MSQLLSHDIMFLRFIRVVAGISIPLIGYTTVYPSANWWSVWIASSLGHCEPLHPGLCVDVCFHFSGAILGVELLPQRLLQRLHHFTFPSATSRVPESPCLLGVVSRERDRMGIAFKVAQLQGGGLTGRERGGLRGRSQREKSRTWAQTKAVGA